MFRFRLQSVLEVRERLARLRQKEFSEVLAQRHAMEAQIEAFRQGLAKAGRYVDQARKDTVSAHPMELYGNYYRRVTSEIGRIEEQMREKQQELQAKRNALVEAKRAQRTLEILRDKQQARYAADEGRKEQATMDEVAANYHSFRQQEA